MPLVVEHTIYSVVNVLRPAVWTNQNNFAQLLCNRFSCCVHCNLPMPISSHSVTTVICTSHTRINSITCTTIVFAFNYFLCDNTLSASCAYIATRQFFDPASPGSFDSISCKPGHHQHLISALWTISFYMPKFTACKTFNLACISLLRLSLRLQKSLHTGIPERSKHDISQVHRRIARATCTT